MTTTRLQFTDVLLLGCTAMSMAALGVLAGVTIASRAARPAQSDTEFDITSPKRQVSGKKLAGDAKNAARMTMYNMVNSPEMFDELKKIAKVPVPQGGQEGNHIPQTPKTYAHGQQFFFFCLRVGFSTFSSRFYCL